eukprot:7389627-Prymnesium_polylepis.1
MLRRPCRSPRMRVYERTRWNECALARSARDRLRAAVYARSRSLNTLRRCAPARRTSRLSRRRDVADPSPTPSSPNHGDEGATCTLRLLGSAE